MRLFCFLAIITFGTPNISFSDEVRSLISWNCFVPKGSVHSEIFTVRVFWSEMHWAGMRNSEAEYHGLKSLSELNNLPVQCNVSGEIVEFSAKNYVPPRPKGDCGGCDNTGFLLSVDGVVIWEAKQSSNPRHGIFNGTLDFDRNLLRICEEQSSQADELRETGSASSRVLNCETVLH